MKKIISLFIIFILFGLVRESYGFWIWTPELGKWINPKHIIKDTPGEQFQLAYSLWQEGKIKQALEEFKKVPKYFPKSKYAPESQYYIGRCFEKQRKYYKAFKAYQKLIDKYPYTSKIDEVVEREYKIGNLFFVKNNGNQNIWQKFSLSDPNSKAIEVFEKVIENQPYGDYAYLSQFKIGLCWERMKNYPQAEEAYKKVITNYPTSELVDDAIYHLALVTAKKQKKIDYSQEETEQTIKRLEELSKKGTPDPNAEKVLKELKEKKAKSLFKIAKFYEKQKFYKSAKIYYNDILKNYPKTSWAVKSAVEMKKLEKKNK